MRDHLAVKGKLNNIFEEKTRKEGKKLKSEWMEMFLIQ